MSNVTHYTRVRKYMDEQGLTEATTDAKRSEAAALDASLAVSTALREITQAVSSGFRDANNKLLTALEYLDQRGPRYVYDGVKGHAHLKINPDHIVSTSESEDGAMLYIETVTGKIYTVEGEARNIDPEVSA